MNIPFLNLQAQYESLKSELLPVVEAALASGHYILGPQVKAFEDEIASFIGVRFGVGVNSGSDALTLALRALELKAGDEIITTPFTYIAPAEAIHQAGCRIVFADIDPKNFNLDPVAVRKKLTPQTRALIPVHLFGQAAPMEELLGIARETNLEVIEDCAQAIGGAYRKKPIGSMGRLACFSFYPTKNLGANGDGGMVLTSDEGLAQRLRMLRVHGIQRRYYHDLHGYNSRLDEIQAAMLRVKLKHLNRWNRRRIEIASRYHEGLRDLPLTLPDIPSDNGHVFHVYAVLSEKRDALQRFLAERGISVLIYYPQPLHLQAVYRELGYGKGDFPVAEAVSEKILPLPMYPELSDAEVAYVISQIRAFPF